MPQLVSLFNATGGACAVLLVIVEANQVYNFSFLQSLSLIFGAITGAVAATGSIIALLKLSGNFKGLSPVRNKLLAKVSLCLILLLMVSFTSWSIGLNFFQLVVAISILAFALGVFFVSPIGGADMPVVISLLNAVTGVATALAGSLFNNKIMLAGGVIVGASGLILTSMMCKAMNRSLWKVITGKYNATSSNEDTAQDIIETNYSETALLLGFAKKVAIIPGYGLAVAQAQHLCKQLENLLTDKGVLVHYVIHPVAGRMPGHMNVLLAEANVNYNSLKEMSGINESLDQYDIALIIGANDVVNPAAESNPNSPIYGMPIIQAYKCKAAVVLKRSMNKGYAGVANELFNEPNCKILFGDAKDSIQNINNELKLV